MLLIITRCYIWSTSRYLCIKHDYCKDNSDVCAIYEQYL